MSSNVHLAFWLFTVVSLCAIEAKEDVVVSEIQREVGGPVRLTTRRFSDACRLRALFLSYIHHTQLKHALVMSDRFEQELRRSIDQNSIPRRQCGIAHSIRHMRQETHSKP